MSGLKTGLNDASVAEFIAGVDDPVRRHDCEELISMMRDATGAEPKLWGSSIVGFGSYHYRYDSGREGDWMLCGFSPRKHSLTIYIMPGFSAYADLMKKLGKHKTGKSCLYINRLRQIDREVLCQLIDHSVQQMKAMYETTSSG